MIAAIEEFRKRAEAVGAQVERVATRQAAREFIFGVLLQEGIADIPGAYAVWADCPLFDAADRQNLSSRIPGLRFSVTREVAAQAKVGISQVDQAIADTGTLVDYAEQVERRLVSTLPHVHVALVSTHSIVPNLVSALSQIDPTKMRYVAFITGPSRTADIERVLTIGVHGPSRLIIVMVDEVGVTQ